MVVRMGGTYTVGGGGGGVAVGTRGGVGTGGGVAVGVGRRLLSVAQEGLRAEGA